MNKTPFKQFRFVCWGISLLAAVGNANSQHLHQPGPQAMAQTSRAEDVRLDGFTLINRDGRVLDLAADIIGDRIVVVDFIYTRCTTICPILSGIMQHVQHALEACLDTHVALLSISVDPLHDQPQQLDAMAQRFGASGQWYWLTASQPMIDRLLGRFGLPSGAPEDHPPLLLIGKQQSAAWRRWIGIPKLSELINAVREQLPAEAHACIARA